MNQHEIQQLNHGIRQAAEALGIHIRHAANAIYGAIVLAAIIWAVITVMGAVV